MGKFIPLPKLVDLPEVVLFHHEHPSDRRLLLQVPTGPDDGETYIVRLDETEHRLWFERLPNYKALRDRLSYEMHVAFYPQSGTVMTLEDPDEVHWVQQAFAAAHQTTQNPISGMFARRSLRRNRIPRPQLRTALQFGGRK
jgi:hypothetical protein